MKGRLFQRKVGCSRRQIYLLWGGRFLIFPRTMAGKGGGSNHPCAAHSYGSSMFLFVTMQLWQPSAHGVGPSRRSELKASSTFAELARNGAMYDESTLYTAPLRTLYQSRTSTTSPPSPIENFESKQNALATCMSIAHDGPQGRAGHVTNAQPLVQDGWASHPIWIRSRPLQQCAVPDQCGTDRSRKDAVGLGGRVGFLENFKATNDP